MKTKVLLLLTCLIALSSFKPVQNTDDDQIYKVTIFKWSKNEKGEEQKKFVTISQDGSITVSKQVYNKKVNIKAFNKAIDKFIQTEKLTKSEANYDPPRVAIIPKNEEQSISITIIKLKDYNSEKGKDFSNNSQYSWRKLKKSSDENIEIYQYLKSDDLKILKKILNK